MPDRKTKVTKTTKGTPARPSPSPSLRSLPPGDAEGFIPPHGGYQKLLSYQKALVVYQATLHFCDRFIDKKSRTHDQMVQAARSGKQNILEGSQASGTSKETEIKLTQVARASQEELLEDYRDFMRNRCIQEWPHEHRSLLAHQPPRLEKDSPREGAPREPMPRARLAARARQRPYQ